jgi:predicted enzyme related to lactoylglutathione lyase
MSERSGYPQGVPCWTDLSTSDVAGAREFYGGLFGWEWQLTGPEYGDYSTGLLRGRKVAAVASRMDDGQPVTWTTYLAVADVDAFGAAVPAAGGTFVMQHDIGEQGRMAIAIDPAGAPFGVWQAAAHTGAELVDEPGTVVWNELVSPDLATAQAFYAAVLGVGWGSEEVAPGEPYGLLQVGGRTVGGATTPAAGERPHWRVYFEVADTEATAARAVELGGTLVTPVTPTPQGPMATFLDPQGGAFAVIASGSAE